MYFNTVYDYMIDNIICVPIIWHPLYFTEVFRRLFIIVIILFK